MGWISKLFKLAMFAILIGIMVAVGFVIFANPNSYKPEITNWLKTYTNLPFKINGDIAWTLRPESIVKIQDVVLENENTEEPAIQIKDITVKIELSSLLSSNPKVTSLSLNSPVINWLQTKEILHDSNASGIPLTIQAFDVKNGTFSIKDPDKHLNWILQNVNFSTSSFVLNADSLPALQLEGELINIDHNTNYILETTAKFDIAQHTLTLDPLKMIWNDTPMQGSAIINQFDTDPTISGNFSLPATDVGTLLRKLDPYFANTATQVNHSMQMDTAYAYIPKDSILDLTKFNLQIDKGSMTGEIKLGFTAPYHAEFNLSADNFNFAPLGLLGSALFPATHTMTNFPTNFLKDIVVQGKFTGNQLSFKDDINIDQMRMEVNANAGVVQFSPVLINAYGGTHDIGLRLDATNDELSVQINEQASKVDLEPWLKLIDSDNLISGTTNLKASLHGSGNNITALKQSLNGSFYLLVNNGILYGIDATRLMQFSTQTVTDIFKEISTSPAANINVLAIKQSSNWIQTQLDHPKTNFDSLELTIEIMDGSSKQATLAMNNNVIALKGAGSFILRDQTLNFDTSLTNRQDVSPSLPAFAKYIQQTPLDMTITGTLDKPIFGPNVQGYVTTILQKGTNELQVQALNKMIAASPANAKTDKTATEIFLNSLQSLNK